MMVFDVVDDDDYIDNGDDHGDDRDDDDNLIHVDLCCIYLL